MTERWVLNRAGILNVYQYDDEVLDFGGGRLLLRGVNGSGKSTAMNMLLPFLLDADTRRIDAAGVQSGVLRTWMLTGRDEPQPVGYLWIELARGDAHLVFGCGIRANRSTDNVSTWWFITHLRPHIDVNLIDGRTPRNIDSLREALGPDSFVFTKDQRNAYRDELRHRLFGGADLEQHIRLLHVLRNPTVGDKIDTDLERYLDEALPQLSEQAIDDAAQPLEDLEEHRRNVAQLTATDEAIRALAATYSAYARGELRRTAGRASKAVGDVDALRREYGRRDKTAERASRALEAARAAVATTQADIDRLTSEIEALRDQPLYQEGKSLEDLDGSKTSLVGSTTNDGTSIGRQAAATTKWLRRPVPLTWPTATGTTQRRRSPTCATCSTCTTSTRPWPTSARSAQTIRERHSVARATPLPRVSVPRAWRSSSGTSTSARFAPGSPRSPLPRKRSHTWNRPGTGRRASSTRHRSSMPAQHARRPKPRPTSRPRSASGSRRPRSLSRNSATTSTRCRRHRRTPTCEETASRSGPAPRHGWRASNVS